MNKPRLPNFCRRLDSYVQRVGRPVLQGEIALEVGCSLVQVEREMTHLLESGDYARLSIDELKKLGYGSETIAFKRLGNKF